MHTRYSWQLFVAVGFVVFAVLLIGGYGLGWSWTGFSDEDTLWAWLQLLILPIALGLWPIWYATRVAHRAHWRAFTIVTVVAFAIVLVGGYALDWTWTGFQGNTLWDWWKLLLVPFVLPTVFTWVSLRESQPQARPAPRVSH